METLIFLFAASVFAGAINGVAGGGGLIVFPALLFTGVEAVAANATNATALWFGTATSSFAYRHELKQEQRKQFLILSATSVIGGILGSHLLLYGTSANFSALVPYLMLFATLLFTFNQPLLSWINNQFEFRLPMLAIVLLQLAIAIYGGYFGGGGGILMLAVLNIMGIRDIHAVNGLKSWLATCLNAVAVVHFAFLGKILIVQAIVMAVGATIGACSSAYFARLLPVFWVRRFIIGISWSITIYFWIETTFN